MPSWMWVLIVLAAITAIALVLLWYLGLLGSSFDRAREAGMVPRRDDTPSDNVPSKAAPSAPPPKPTAAPPPAMAGPQRGDASPHVPEARRAQPPPAATAEPSHDVSRPAETPTPKRSAKPPPAQAAWSEPPVKPKSKKR